MTKAKETFLDLGRQWYKHVESLPDKSILPQRCDKLALSCLLLAVEYSDVVDKDTENVLKANRRIASERGALTWIDELPWELCESSQIKDCSRHPAGRKLVANLNHHKSDIRCWMMEIAWFALPLLPVQESVSYLLDNVASTLRGPFMAAGLAARLFPDDEQFFKAAEVYSAGHFEKQYRNRLEFIRKRRLVELQADFRYLENECRKLIIKSCLESDSGYCNSGSE